MKDFIIDVVLLWVFRTICMGAFVFAAICFMFSCI